MVRPSLPHPWAQRQRLRLHRRAVWHDAAGGVDDTVLAGRARAGDGQLAIGRNRYRAIILPDVERMPPATLRAVEAFAKQGVHVFATRRTPALALTQATEP